MGYLGLSNCTSVDRSRKLLCCQITQQVNRPAAQRTFRSPTRVAVDELFWSSRQVG
jgi:hypothetical protein